METIYLSRRKKESIKKNHKLYKDRVLEAIDRKLQKLYKVIYCGKDQKGLISKECIQLQTVKAKVLKTDNHHFTPTRFPSSIFVSIKLSIPDIIDKIYIRKYAD